MGFNRQLFDQINRKYAQAHDDITDKYYKEKTLSKEQFDILHELVWLLHEKERYDNGFYSDRELPDEILNSEEFQADLQERQSYLSTRIPELQSLREQKCPDFKYTFEK